VSYEYDAYAKRLQASLETRAADLQLDHPHGISEKAKVKRRATDDDTDLETSIIPQEYEIPPEFHPALMLAKSVLGYRTVGEEQRIEGDRRGSSTRLDLEELEVEIKQRLPSLEYKVDQLFSVVSAANDDQYSGESAKRAV